MKFIKEKYGYSDIKDIDEIINTIIEFDNFNHVTPRRYNEVVKCDGKKGANELFLFSILTGRFEIAKLFWKKGSVSLNYNYNFFFVFFYFEIISARIQYS